MSDSPSADAGQAPFALYGLSEDFAGLDDIHDYEQPLRADT
jgi:hypothetical protein